MLRDLRRSISDEIQVKQIKKQKLFDEISKIDSELLELNEILVKISTDDAFFKISPNEAFEILDSLGYKDNKEKLEMYVSLLTSKKEKTNKIVDDDKFVKIINSSISKINDSVDQKKKFKLIVKYFDENLDYDNYYYFVNGVKIGKFRLFYNLVSLLGEKYKKDDILDLFKFAFCYKNVKDSEKKKVYDELEKMEEKLVKLV